MKIKVTEERECCDERKGDLIRYKGELPPTASRPHVYVFCKHCGQLWVNDLRMDGAGSSEDYLRKIVAKFS